MAKVMTAKVKLQCPGGQATPAPPVGPALGQHGVNIGLFVMQFNERTKDMKGTTIPVEITVYSDRTFEFIVKSPPAAVLLKQAAGIPLEKKKGGELIPAEEKTKGSGKYKGFKVTLAQVQDIAKLIQDWEQKKHLRFCASSPENSGSGRVSELREVEKVAILDAVHRLGVRRAAAALGLGKTTIYRKLREYEAEAKLQTSTPAIAEDHAEGVEHYRTQ